MNSTRPSAPWIRTRVSCCAPLATRGFERLLQKGRQGDSRAISGCIRACCLYSGLSCCTKEFLAAPRVGPCLLLGL